MKTKFWTLRNVSRTHYYVKEYWPTKIILYFIPALDVSRGTTIFQPLKQQRPVDKKVFWIQLVHPLPLAPSLSPHPSFSHPIYIFLSFSCSVHNGNNHLFRPTECAIREIIPRTIRNFKAPKNQKAAGIRKCVASRSCCNNSLFQKISALSYYCVGIGFHGVPKWNVIVFV